MKVHCSADTHVGQQRQVNQDAYRVQEEPQPDDIGQLMVLCDGMGGHMAGEVASRLGVDTILETYYASHQDDRLEVLREAFHAANTQIYEAGQGTMGTTGVALLVRGERLDVANVGDSRAYLVREGRIQQLTQDHSFVWEQVAAGVLTKEQARHSHYRNMITRALGHRPDIEVDFFVEQAAPGDVLVLSSDGLHGLLEDAEIAQAVSSMAPAKAVQWLIDEANQRGGTDNITVIVAQLEPSGEADHVPPPLPDAESNATATTQPMTAPTGNDDGDGDDGGSPPAAADAAAPAPAAGWRRASVWGGVLVVVLLALIGGATFVLGGDEGLLVPPAEATETPTLSPTRATETPTLSPTRATETPTLSPTQVLTLTLTPRTSPPVAPSFPTTASPPPMQDAPTVSPTVSLFP